MVCCIPIASQHPGDKGRKTRGSRPAWATLYSVSRNKNKYKIKQTKPQTLLQVLISFITFFFFRFRDGRYGILIWKKNEHVMFLDIAKFLPRECNSFHSPQWGRRMPFPHSLTKKIYCRTSGFLPVGLWEMKCPENSTFSSNEGEPLFYFCNWDEPLPLIFWLLLWYN